MSRTLRAGWACALAVLGAGCQDYNFNPVGHCVIQPGSKRVTLSNISSADVLFVVDDSGSMGGEQAKLAANFTRFIANLDATNAARASAGLDPFDFHLAVSTTSVFWNYLTPNTCSAVAGQLLCCKTDGTPAKQPKRGCTSNVECTAGTTCGINCNGFKGESVCCNQADGSFPVGSVTENIPCSREGTACGTLETHYDFGTCTAGVAVDQWPFPGGDFVSWSDPPGAGTTRANPRVLHFDKELYTGTTNQQGFTRAQLVDFFKGGVTPGNVIVGTCGSGQEQGLAAARLAIERAVSGSQKDTYARVGTGTPPVPQQTWTAATRTAGSPADWLAPGRNSKLVVVFVGDEDDCSSPKDPSGGVVMLAEPPGADACTRDALTGPPLGQKEYTVASFVDYFMGLGRPVGAAFIESAAQTSCSGLDSQSPGSCTPGTCCQPDCPSLGVCGHDSQCGGQAPASRFFAAAGELKARGADVVVGSICDPLFGDLLDAIAEIVKPPSGLALPSLPAAGEVTLLRIAGASGQTRKICTGPLAPAGYTLQQAQDSGADWWFAPSGDPGPPVAGPTRFVYINPKGRCIANPGETYSADYLGKLPAGGCGNDTASATSGDEMCQRLLGGATGSWTCFAGASGAGACLTPTWDAAAGTGSGTCICGSRASNCP